MIGGQISTGLRSAVRSALDLLRLAWDEFRRHRARRLGAGLAYYSIFALVPTLFLALAIVAAFFGREVADGRLVDALDDVIGLDAAEQIDEAIADLFDNSGASGFAIISGLVVVYSASILFVAWRDSLDAIWDVPFQGGLKTSIRRRLFGAVVPVAIGIALAGIVLVEMLTTIAGDLVTAPLLDATLNAVRSITPTVMSVVVLGLLYRLSTRRRPAWRDVWIGTAFAAVALAVLAWGYGLYVRLFGGSSAAGAAGTVILGLAFIYYSAQVLLFGGGIISASAIRRGHPIGEPPETSTR